MRGRRPSRCRRDDQAEGSCGPARIERFDRAHLDEALRNHVRERIAHIKCPRWFEIVDELPKTSTGKIQRFRMRQQAAAN
ncbi:MAG: hypothetical protein AB7V13_06205 [Pseudorhodoplanes sp.]